MPINPTTLLKDLQKWVKTFEDDLRLRCKEVPELDARLKGQYEAARKAKRTGHPYATWRDETLTQSAVAWVLTATFVRFLEDNGLLETPWLSGPGELREIAGETRAAYFNTRRTDSDDDYLRHAFRQVATLPGMADLFDERHNDLWNAGISGDAAKGFIEFWRKIDPDTGRLAHDFTDPDWNTRFLGDLYQSLSESARKRFALLQTPDFVEEFILDRTLEPAIVDFGYEVVRLIDPTCGSGHFLLGTLARLLARWQKGHPELGEREIAMKALAAVHGVDINPFAVAIARFRLLLAAWRFCGVKKLRDAPDFHLNLATGDSLLHGRRFRRSEGESRRQALFETEDEVFADELKHFYQVEDRTELHRILGRQYHAVVGNPPYITVKDKALNEAYRQRFDSCSGKYALSVPFMERFFELAITGDHDEHRPAGYVGQITANSFMKREFGKKLIEAFIPKWDLTHVIDTAGAYIPGHGTPTVILFGRHQEPVCDTLRTVLGIKGEPSTPEDPAQGQVWSAILAQIDQPGSQSAWVSVGDTERTKFHQHPWSIGGGGAAELKELLDQAAHMVLGEIADQLRGKPNIGITCFTLEDDVYVQPLQSLIRQRVSRESTRTMIEGDRVRDWTIGENDSVVWPYTLQFHPITEYPESSTLRFLWFARTCLANNVMFGKQTKLEAGLRWYEFGRLTSHKLRTPFSITFGEIATHNHFVLDRGGKVFKQTAPVIKLKPDASEDNHLRLVGLLNSSSACFWLKQVCHNKGSTVDAHGARQRTDPFEDFYAFNGTKLASVPVPVALDLDLSRAIQEAADEETASGPAQLLAIWTKKGGDLAAILAAGAEECGLRRRRMIAWQEELDWHYYDAYGLIDSDSGLAIHGQEAVNVIPRQGIDLGERAFEILMAWKIARQTLETTWFERHREAGSKPVTQPPADWPESYLRLYHLRHTAIQNNLNVALIERPEYKRRWNTEPWAKRRQTALENWLLTRIETWFHDSDRMVGGQSSAVSGQQDEEPVVVPEEVKSARRGHGAGTEFQFTTVKRLAAAATRDPKFMEAAAVYTGEEHFAVERLVEKLVLAAAVPFLPAQRYKPPGLRKRVQWEETWRLQRLEDAIDAAERVDEPGLKDVERLRRKEAADKRKKAEVGDIPVPPKFGSGDFKKSVYWSLRGKLDVPKERFILYPGAEGGWDESPVLAWAGWDHAQQARALCGYYQQAQESWGWPESKLALLLAGLADLLPWLHQWHSDIDPEYHERLSTIYQTYFDQQIHALRMTVEAVEGVRMGEKC